MSTDADVIRTTVTVRADLYQRAKREGVSLSDILAEALEAKYRRRHTLFGAFPALTTDDVRDHEDRLG